jgi:prolyl-tRNA synthetase
MKDAYSFDLDEAGARHSYNRMFIAYLRTFARMGLTAIPMQADTGPIGGDLSHEFIILAPSGESEVFYDAALLEQKRVDELMEMFVTDSYDEVGGYQQVVEHITHQYAATDEKRDEYQEAFIGDALRTSRGIEVGHIFYFGTKYTKAMNMVVQTPDGGQVHPEMGSYGIGVSRLVGALIEASHDEGGIVWPEAVAPYRVGLINMRADDPRCAAAADDLYTRLQAARVDTLYDDRDERGGAKFATMDLIGLPWQLIVGPKGLERGIVELKRRATGEREELSPESALARLAA